MPGLSERVSRLTTQQRALLDVWLRKDAGPELYPGAVRQKKLLAYVVPDHNAAGAEDGEDGEQAAEQVGEWQQVYDSLYSVETAHPDPEFNITGWSNTSTGQPIPADEMREWLNHTVARILQLKPKRVLEIGCGTGLLLFRIAPKVDHYHGIDFSEPALAYLRSHLNLPNVTLERRLADELPRIEAGVFDLVILNSVVQYFPDLEYFVRVVQDAVNILAPGGHIFAGDIRSLPLLEAFHAGVELSRSEGELPASQLRDRVRRRVEAEKELFLDPQLFFALASRIPRITAVEVQPKRGHARNELTAFRYDVVLQVDVTPPAPEIVQPRRAGLRNARVTDAVELSHILRSDNLAGTVSNLRDLLAQGRMPAYFPEDFAEPGCDLHLCWSQNPDCFDVVLVAGSEGPLLEAATFSGTQNLAIYANDPLRASRMKSLAPVLRSYLQRQLPEYMVPSDFIALDALPLSPNGKVDRNALPPPGAPPARSGSAHVAPTNPVEQALVKMWADILGVERVGIDDNFFDLGGHSLLATRLVSRVRHTFHVELPLRSLFERPTVADQAIEIEELLLHEIENLPEDKARGLVGEQR